MLKSINEIKILAMDMIDSAKSGHPGMAIGSAPAMYTLFNHVINITSLNDKWLNRDRFVLSSGHASALLYTLLHLSGFKISLDDLKRFRQLNSLTPGHPEYLHTPGVDATTGPLGQGVAMAVGMALAEKLLAHRYNKKDIELFNHYTYVLCGDGDMQEGITQEAISFAGNLGLEKLILLYDSNDVTLDGPLNTTFSEDVAKRFISAKWNVIEIENGKDYKKIESAIKKAQKSDKPTLIIYKTIIGEGSVDEGTSLMHGTPLTNEDLLQLRRKLNVSEEKFSLSLQTYNDFKNNLIKRGNKEYYHWLRLKEKYQQKYPIDYQNLLNALERKINFNSLDDYNCELNKSISTRSASNKFLNFLADQNDFLIGGSADVAKSVMTYLKDKGEISFSNYNGQNLNFGIREFAMTSISNGMLLHSGIVSFIGTFLVFSDYAKPALRLASLMSLPLICLFSHDSIAVGEDGPTHQPIEQLAMLRSIPNFSLIRPSNELETKYAFKIALEAKKPTSIILTRQNIETLHNPSFDDFKKGAYFVYHHEDALFTIVASGSELNLAIKIYQRLLNEKIIINVISFPSWDLFENQDDVYKQLIFKDINKTISIEMLSSFGWSKYAKHNLSVETFGKSAKANDLINDYEFDLDSLYQKIITIIKQ